jgi:hypothetical protein
LSAWGYLAVPLLFLLLKVLLIDPQLTPLRQTQLQAGAVQNVQTPLQIDYGDQLRLLGYSVSPGSAPAGETVRVDLYWRALRPLDRNYQTTVGLIDANGEVWSPKTLDRPRDYQDYPPTNTWPADAYVVEAELPSNPGTRPENIRFSPGVRARLAAPTCHAAASAGIAPLAAYLACCHARPTRFRQELGIYNLRRSAAPELNCPARTATGTTY